MSQTKKSFIFPNLLTVAVLISCGKKNSSDSSGPENPFIGNWLTSKCDNNTSHSTRTMVEIAAAGWYSWGKVFSDSTCTSEIFQMRMMSSTYTSPNSQPMTVTTFRNDELRAMMTSEIGVQSANIQKFCDLVDWKLNTIQNIRDQKCLWKFGDSTILWGTEQEDPFVSYSISYYFKRVGDKLCFSEKVIDEATSVEECMTKIAN